MVSCNVNCNVVDTVEGSRVAVMFVLVIMSHTESL